mmetsp:Transcript_90488/g.235620  ORF Transcript_90488/g.235620 Transcript_90488/m.235620 type:complete len:301 (+) Transcript_90488:76-978(+)
MAPSRWPQPCAGAGASAGGAAAASGASMAWAAGGLTASGASRGGGLRIIEISSRSPGNDCETTPQAASSNVWPACCDFSSAVAGSQDMTRSRFFSDCLSASWEVLGLDASLTRTCRSRRKSTGKPSGEDRCQSALCVRTTLQLSCAVLARLASATSGGRAASPTSALGWAWSSGNRTCSRHSCHASKGIRSHGTDSPVSRSSSSRCRCTKACAEDLCEPFLAMSASACSVGTHSDCQSPAAVVTEREPRASWGTRLDRFSRAACAAGPLLWEANAFRVESNSWNCCSDRRRDNSWSSLSQ